VGKKASAQRVNEEERFQHNQAVTEETRGPGPTAKMERRSESQPGRPVRNGEEKKVAGSRKLIARLGHEIGL